MHQACIRRSAIVLLTCQVGSLLACWGYGSGGDEGIEDEDNNPMFSTTPGAPGIPGTTPERPVNPNKRETWLGWNPPAGAADLWANWIKNYKKDNHGKGGRHIPKIHGKYPYGHGIEGWPIEWDGLGPPLEGAQYPPPWAYVPRNTGRPRYCYEPPLPGDCKEKLERWAYNSFANECQNYTYTGCHGSGNKFVNWWTCHTRCVWQPPTGCDLDSKLPLKSLPRPKWRRCGYSDDDPGDYDVRNY